MILDPTYTFGQTKDLKLSKDSRRMLNYFVIDTQPHRQEGSLAIHKIKKNENVTKTMPQQLTIPIFYIFRNRLESLVKLQTNSFYNEYNFSSDFPFLFSHNISISTYLCRFLVPFNGILVDF